MKFKLKTKTILSIGMLSAVIAPVSIAVSCGKTSLSKTESLLKKLEKAKRTEKTIDDYEEYKTGVGYEEFIRLTSEIASGLGLDFNWDLTNDFKVEYSLSRVEFAEDNAAKYNLKFKVSLDIVSGDKKIVQSNKSIELKSSDKVTKEKIHKSIVVEDSKKIMSWSKSNTSVANSILNFLQTSSEFDFEDFDSTIARALGFNSMPTLTRGTQLHYSLVTKEINENEKGKYLLNIKLTYSAESFVVSNIEIRSSDVVNEDVINMQFAIQRLQQISTWAKNANVSPKYEKISGHTSSTYIDFDDSISSDLGFGNIPDEYKTINGLPVIIEYTLVDESIQLPDQPAKYLLNFKITVSQSSIATRTPILISTSDNVPHTTLSVLNFFLSRIKSDKQTHERIDQDLKTDVYKVITKDIANLFEITDENWRDFSSEFKVEYTLVDKLDDQGDSLREDGQVVKYVLKVKVTSVADSADFEESTSIDYNSSNALPHTKNSILEIFINDRPIQNRPKSNFVKNIKVDWTVLTQEIATEIGITGFLPNENDGSNNPRFVWEYTLMPQSDADLPGVQAKYDLGIRVKEGSSDTSPVEAPSKIELKSNLNNPTLQKEEKDRIQAIIDKLGTNGDPNTDKIFPVVDTPLKDSLPSEIKTDELHELIQANIKNDKVGTKDVIAHEYSAVPADRNDALGLITISIIISNTVETTQDTQEIKITIKGLKKTTERLLDIQKLMIQTFGYEATPGDPDSIVNEVVSDNKDAADIDALMNNGVYIAFGDVVTLLGISSIDPTTIDLKGTRVQLKVRSGSATGSGTQRRYIVDGTVSINQASVAFSFVLKFE